MCCACLVRVCSFQVTWCGPGNFRNPAEYIFGLPGDFIGVPVISQMWYHIRSKQENLTVPGQVQMRSMAERMK